MYGYAMICIVPNFINRRLAKRLLLIELFFRARMLGITDVRIAHKKIWTGAHFANTVLVLKAPLALIRVRHFEKGMIAVQDSPHFDYVRSAFGVRRSAFGVPNAERLKFRDYHRRQPGGGEEFCDPREENFQNLISTFLEGNATFEILVEWDSSTQFFRVVDGFHRLACIAALDPDLLVTCRVVA